MYEISTSTVLVLALILAMVFLAVVKINISNALQKHLDTLGDESEPYSSRTDGWIIVNANALTLKEEPKEDISETSTQVLVRNLGRTGDYYFKNKLLNGILTDDEKRAATVNSAIFGVAILGKEHLLIDGQTKLMYLKATSEMLQYVSYENYVRLHKIANPSKNNLNTDLIEKDFDIPAKIQLTQLVPMVLNHACMLTKTHGMYTIVMIRESLVKSLRKSKMPSVFLSDELVKELLMVCAYSCAIDVPAMVTPVDYEKTMSLVSLYLRRSIHDKYKAIGLKAID